MSDSEFFTAEEAADRLGLQIRTLYLYIRQGKIKAQKVGKSLRVPKESVFDHLSQNRTKGVVVVKVGTQVLLDDDDQLDLNILKRYAHDISELSKDGWKIILVSSGAMGAGLEVFSGNTIKDRVLRKQVLASVGQARLMHYYSDFFAKEGYKVAQVLLERGNFSDRKRFVSMRAVVTEALANGIVPIVNENDVIADKELRFGDNDELAALMAVMMDADKLIICSSISGLFDCDPKKNSCAQVVSEVSNIDEEVLNMCGTSISEHGMGGMLTKIQSMKMATQAGIEAFIINGKQKNNLTDTIRGDSFVGTRFLAKKGGMKGFKKWLHAGALSFGKIIVDDGAAVALQKRKSLLLPGIKSIEGDFEKRDTVDVYNLEGDTVAVGIVNYGSKELYTELNRKEKRGKKEVIHVDNILLL
ncbi:glutamate 5-kinase [Candidatus Peregrinibacteria bacterium CG22_combo_CG10-13_8_21_14_all_44_10]|nr:MAG: glutamate 5-kinase [Candidatus Peregrinibacteria bacterium CG22_combo_CG10-13_8_21_14_all_44_10]PIX80144.1 MAG: glutamate 5-kinase [Candidatus Peregrinibacteria bacterium CG_4_10_14_3_um_filter_44_21]PJB88774.1 MAG: glutamate 5-kinase [Candidatus Peregrinibacteria bacterium CG_4_9_14_0_8_um_filter_44_15]